MHRDNADDDGDDEEGDEDDRTMTKRIIMSMKRRMTIKGFDITIDVGFVGYDVIRMSYRIRPQVMAIDDSDTEGKSSNGSNFWILKTMIFN